MSKFVKCVDGCPPLLKTGQLYEVDYEDTEAYYLKDCGGSWYKWRFDEQASPPSAQTVPVSPPPVPEEPPFDFDAYNGVVRK